MVYSELGQGTTFKIYLPLTEVPAEDGRGRKDRRSHSAAPRPKLLCEDEGRDLRKLVRSMLTKNGYQILEAETPLRALEICREHQEPIHLLLTDIVMPQISGFDLAREVVAMRPDIKVLYMSGYGDNRVERQMGVRPVLRRSAHKPFTVIAS